MCFRLVKAAGGTTAKSFRAGPESPSHLLPTDAGGDPESSSTKKNVTMEQRKEAGIKGLDSCRLYHVL